MDTDIYKIVSELDNSAVDIVKLLYGGGLKISVAESCTGGLISGAMTSVPGSSGVFECGFCTYADIAKIKYLNVREETLSSCGAVSAETAAEMARGVKNAANADIGISVTGIAGPGGAVPGKPVGSVYLGLAYKDDVRVLHLRVSYCYAGGIGENLHRAYIRYETVRQAFIMLRDYIRLNIRQ